MSSAVTSFWKSTKHLPRGLRRRPQRLELRRIRRRPRRAWRGRDVEPERTGRRLAEACAGGQRIGEREVAVGRPGDGHARRQVIGHERGQRLVPARLVAALRGQVQRRRPAARHRDQVAVDAMAAAVVAPRPRRLAPHDRRAHRDDLAGDGRDARARAARHAADDVAAGANRRRRPPRRPRPAASVAVVQPSSLSVNTTARWPGSTP